MLTGQDDRVQTMRIAVQLPGCAAACSICKTCMYTSTKQLRQPMQEKVKGYAGVQLCKDTALEVTCRVPMQGSFVAVYKDGISGGEGGAASAKPASWL